MQVLLECCNIKMESSQWENCLADLFLYSYETDFMQGLLKKSEKKLTQSSNFTFRYIDDVLSINNYRFGNIKMESSQWEN
jgi:hypothetical protein